VSISGSDFYDNPERERVSERESVVGGDGWVAAADQQIQRAIDTLKKMAAEEASGSFVLFAYRAMTEAEMTAEGRPSSEVIGRRMEIIAGITVTDEVHPDVASLLFYKTVLEMMGDIAADDAEKLDERLRELGHDPEEMSVEQVSHALLEADGMLGDAPE